MASGSNFTCLVAVAMMLFATLPLRAEEAKEESGVVSPLKFYDTMVSKAKDLPSTLPPIIRGDDENSAPPGAVTSQEELTAALKDGKKEVLLTVDADERYDHLEKVRKQWKKSLFFSETDIQNIQQTLLTRKAVEESPEKYASIEALFPGMKGKDIPKKAEPPLPSLPVFRLKSIVVDQKGRWSVFLNDRKLTQKALTEDSDIVPLSVTPRAVTLKWRPADPRHLANILKTAEGATPEIRKSLPDGNRVSAFLPPLNVQKSGVVIFTLRPNQTFVPELAAIYEGLPPAIPAPVQQANTGDDPLALEPVTNNEKSDDILGMLGLGDSPESSTDPGEQEQEQDLDLLPPSQVGNSLSSIINQTRSNTDRLKEGK